MHLYGPVDRETSFLIYHKEQMRLLNATLSAFKKSRNESSSIEKEEIWINNDFFNLMKNGKWPAIFTMVVTGAVVIVLVILNATLCM